MANTRQQAAFSAACKQKLQGVLEVKFGAVKGQVSKTPGGGMNVGELARFLAKREREREVEGLQI